MWSFSLKGNKPRSLSSLGLENVKLVGTHMSTTVKLHWDPFEKEVVHTLYRSMTRSLLYLSASHYDISYNLGACARF